MIPINPDEYYYPEFLLLQKYLSGDWIYRDNKIYKKSGKEVKGYIVGKYRVLKLKIKGFRPAHMKYGKAIWILSHGGICHNRIMQIDHESTNTLDDSLQNLRLTTPKENCNNPNSKVSGGKHWLAKTTDEEREKIYELKREGHTNREIVSLLNLQVCIQQISAIYKQEEKKHAAITN